MIRYKIDLSTEYDVVETDDLSSVDEVTEFIADALHERGEGEFTFEISAFEED